MKSPAELDGVPWHALTHAYGSAEDVPELIRALYLEDEEAVDEALDELHGTIHHQGTVYTASAPAVPFLAHAARHAPGSRDQLLMLLAFLADHEPSFTSSPHWPGSPVAEICAELCRVLPELLPCLTDEDVAVRRTALRVVAAVADLLPDEPRQAVSALVEGRWTEDPADEVRADALVVLDRLGRPVAALDHAAAEVRLAAAVLAAQRCGPPYSPGLVEVFAADGATDDRADDAFPWPDGSSRREQLTGLLVEAPEAGLAVAGRWSRAEDAAARGAWLATHIGETWRDREPAVLDALLVALSHRATTTTLRAIAHWVERLPEPGAGLRDTLHRCADTAEESAEPALRALVRTRDERALDLVLRRPGAQLLKEAARAFPEAGDRLIPVIRRQLAAGATGNEGIALVLALAPFGAPAHQAQPELLDCLRTGRADIVAARALGRTGAPSPEAVELLAEALHSDNASVRAAAAGAHFRLTAEPGPALRTFEELLSGGGQHHWYLDELLVLGEAAAPLLPLIEPLLTAEYEWPRLAAAQAQLRITGSADRAVPVLTALVGPTPVGVRALQALAAVGHAPEELRPILTTFADSPRRLLPDSPFSGEDHFDEELRRLARALLAVRPQPDGL